MFTEQVHRLQELRGQLPEAAIDVFVDILGQCAQTMKHRGEIEIYKDMSGAPDFDSNEPGMGAPFRVLNPESTWDLTNSRVQNGAVAFFHGTVVVVPGGAPAGGGDVGDGVALVVVGGIHVTNIYVDNIYNTSGTDVTGKVKVDSSDTLDYLDAQCKDHTGGAPAYAATDLLVAIDTDTGQLRAYVDTSEIDEFSQFAFQYLTKDTDDNMEFAAPANSATYDASEDLVIPIEASSNSIRYFIDADGIASYNSSVAQYLTHDGSGDWEWVNI